MGKQIKIKATLSENVNKVFRVQSKLYNIILSHKEVKTYPIIINNFNRLEFLEQLVDWLLITGHTNLHIIDNASTYEPLLKYYKKVTAKVYRLDRNMGHEAYWRTHLYQRFGKYYHVYTDPDVLPDHNTPTDFMFFFKSLLDKYAHINKVGFGLKIDDIPDFYPKKKEVINWETNLNGEEIEHGVFKSKIDTTFALYRPGAYMQCWNSTLRLGAPYLLKHMPWYENPAALSTESVYYAGSANDASSWYKAIQNKNDTYKF